MKIDVNWRLFLIAILIIFEVAPLSAQTNGNEWNVSLGAGGSLGKSGYPGLSGGVGGGYTLFLSPQIGLSLGLEASLYSGSLSKDLNEEYLISKNPSGLPNDDKFYFVGDYAGFKERLSAILVQIPVMAQWQKPLDEKKHLYVGAGLKAGLPVSVKWSQTIKTFTATGRSEYLGNQSFVEGHGFGAAKNAKASGKLEMGIPVSLALECGLKWNQLNNYMYTGIFVDYRLNSITPDASKTQVKEYNANAKSLDDHVSNSVLQTNLISDRTGISPFVVGVKLRIAFNIAEKEKDYTPRDINKKVRTKKASSDKKKKSLLNLQQLFHTKKPSPSKKASPSKKKKSLPDLQLFRSRQDEKGAW